MPTSVQHTGIAAHHIVERRILLVVRVTGHSWIALVGGRMRTVLTVMIGITAMGPAEVDVLSYLRLSVLAAVAAVRPWVATCGAARASAGASAAVRPRGSSRGVASAAAVAAAASAAAAVATTAATAVAPGGCVHTNLCVGGRQALSEFVVLAL